MGIDLLLKSLWRDRAGPLLVALQIALALTVVVNVLYLVVQNLSVVIRPTGIDLENVFWVSSSGHSLDYNHAAATTTDLAYLNGIPGVRAAAMADRLPQVFSASSLPFSTEPDGRGTKEGAILFMVSERMVDALGLRLIAGEGFSAHNVKPPPRTRDDAMGTWASEVIVTRAFANKLFPDGNAIGKTIHAGMVNKPSTIIGIVERFQATPLSGSDAEFAEQVVLLPITPPGPNSLYLVRTDPGRLAEVMATVDRNFEGLQSGRFLADLQTLMKTASDTRAQARGNAIILAVVSALVIGVTAVGIFGLASYTVVSRTKQIGTCRALGARRWEIMLQFLIENWLITTCGVVLGSALGLALGVKLSAIFEVPRLPLYYLATSIVVIWLIASIAAMFPARRAAEIEPAIATRTV